MWRRGELKDRKFSEGVTLLEMMVVVTILAILSAIAIPAMKRWIEDVTAGALINSLLTDLQLARSEAIRRGHPVVVCKSSGGQCSMVGSWEQGWLLFADANNNAARDAGEEIIRQTWIEPRGWLLLGNGPVRSYVSYQPLGQTRLINGAFQAGTLTVCLPFRPNATLRRIVINSRGRPRTDRVDGSTARCDG